MGICLSCCKDNDSGQVGEVNERTHLLVDPVRSNANNIQSNQSDDLLLRYPNSVPKGRKDEQSALSRILHETATNVIDVGALDAHDLEQHEFYERVKTYQARLNSLVRWTPPTLIRSNTFLQDVPNPDHVLAKDPIPPQSLDMMSTNLADLTEAMKQVRVEHKEDLVVPFQIP